MLKIFPSGIKFFIYLFALIGYVTAAVAGVDTSKLSGSEKVKYNLTFSANESFLEECLDGNCDYGRLVKLQLISFEHDDSGFYFLANAKRRDWAGFNKYFRYEIGIYKIRHNRIRCGFTDYLGDTSKF